MGLLNSSVRYHLYLKQSGFNFEKVAMLGRQEFFGVSRRDLLNSARKFGLGMSLGDADDILKSHNGYAEGFYHWLGAKIIDSFDASNYENATQIWDMNGQLPDSSRCKYDFVFDGGTLEHVFNYPSALREALTLPALNGIFLSATPADSFLGHGFYQFSPDLAFEVLTPNNGYANLGVYLVEERTNPAFYQISSPEENRVRTEVTTIQPTQMFWCGRRISDVPPSLVVYQPDYSSTWKSEVSSGSASLHPFRSIGSAVSKWLPGRYRSPLVRTARQLINIAAQTSLWDRSWAKRSDKI